MTDYIKREDIYRFAKDQRVKETGAFSKGYNKALLDIMSVARSNEAIPSADVVEVRHGKWIPKEQATAWASYYKCSECGKTLLFDKRSYYQYNFCPECGAEMDGKDIYVLGKKEDGA